MFRAILDAPTILPFASLTGETVNETSTRLPILATANGFIMIDALAAPDAPEDEVLIVMTIRRN